MEQINTKSSSKSSTTTTILEKSRTLSIPISTASGSASAAAGLIVRQLSTKDYKPAAECLAQAFVDDDVARYFLDMPDMVGMSEKQKWKLHLNILRYTVCAHALKGMVTTCGEDYGAVALWMPPGKNIDGLLTLFRSGLWRLYFQLSPEGRHRFFTEFFPLLHDAKHEVLGPRDEHSMYLVYLGTKPSARGKGYAKALIQHGCKMADEWQWYDDHGKRHVGVPVYLESSSDTNIKYYEKFGFHFKKYIHLKRAEKDVSMGIMVREPNAVAYGSNVKA